VREIEHLWIPLPDGARLAARAWLPGGAGAAPAPAVIEYIPYGKRVGTRDRDEPMHRWFAGHGYAALRIDLRGAGESDGVLRDEYLQVELDDGAAAIAWIAAQPWCSGAVGLIGKSWGGFNALQIAALRPPALRAVVTVCSTDDRYSDDAHYMGGCPIIDNLSWGATFFQLCAQPPDPELYGPGWRAEWRDRLEACEPHPARWLRHPLRDAYWRHGSVCEDYGAIEVPVYAVGGWADAYTDAIPRLLAGLRGPRQGLIGPWGHQYPHQGAPGPAVGFLQEARRFWDRWLRGSGDGLDGEPLLRAWMQESVPAGSEARERPGRWIAETQWPSPRAEPRAFALGRGTLAAPGREGAGSVLEVRSPQTVGRAAASFFASGVRDQRDDDRGSLCFESEPLSERLEILGRPELRLALASDRPTAFLAARLCDVAPDGGSIRVSYGILNLTHREDHTRCEPLVPGRRFEAALPLRGAGHAFPAGHRLRLALSTCYWPLVWPSPEPVVLQVFTEGCRLVLPVRPPAPADAALRPFEEPEAAPEPALTVVSQGRSERKVEEDPATGDLTTRWASGRDDSGGIALSRFDDVGMDGGDAGQTLLRIHPSDPLRARIAIAQQTELRRGDWRVEIATSIDLSCTRTHFHVEAKVEGREQGGMSFERRFDEHIPRVGN
jgi:putative CocE/NonD family hydrolase